jgi:hypothetical protein
LFFAATIFFSGCSTVSVRTKLEKDSDKKKYIHNNETNTFRYKPVIGTEQDDTKVMINMGKFAKIWIKNYRNKNKTFIASHHMVTMIQEPGFIAGEDLPQNRYDAVSKTYGANTFTFKSSDLLYDTGTDAENVKAYEIKKYMNNHEEESRKRSLLDEKRVKVNKYDAEIKEYLEMHRDSRNSIKAERDALKQNVDFERKQKEQAHKEIEQKQKELARKQAEIEKLKQEQRELDKKIKELSYTKGS